MIKFNRCYPDANNFDRIIKLKKIENWKSDYVDLGQGMGYWIAEDPFLDNGFDLIKELISKFPIQKDNSHPENPDPNPFDTIHLPEWIYKNICFFLRDFYVKKYNIAPINPQIHEWGNVYYKNTSRPVECWRIPHVDYHRGFVGNLWFTDHEENDSLTKFYKYHGSIIEDVYDFQIDKNHKLHDVWRQISKNPKRADRWFNFTDEELASWNFEFIGSAPTRERTMTMYRSDICHVAYVSENVDFRWSHTFAYSYLERNDLKIKDVFNL